VKDFNFNFSCDRNLLRINFKMCIELIFEESFGEEIFQPLSLSDLSRKHKRRSIATRISISISSLCGGDEVDLENWTCFGDLLLN
jgi:hypothetical protein